MLISKWKPRRLVQLFNIPSLTLSWWHSNVCLLIGSSFLIILYRAMTIACCITFNTAAGWRPGCLVHSPSCTYINKFTKCSLGRIIMDQSLYIAGNLDLVFWERKASILQTGKDHFFFFWIDLDVNKTSRCILVIVLFCLLLSEFKFKWKLIFLHLSLPLLNLEWMLNEILTIQVKALKQKFSLVLFIMLS